MMKKQSLSKLLLPAAITSLLIPVTSYSQTVDPTVDPGRVGDRFLQERRPEIFNTPLIEVDKSSTETSGSDSGAKFLLKDIEFKGSNEISSEDLKKEIGGLIGSEISLNQVNEIANIVTVKYRSEGFISTKAIVPPQKIKNGVLTVEVIEGGVDQVIIQGDISSDKEIIQRFADKIKSAGAMSSNKLERYLLLIDDLPGVSARAVLKPSSSRVGYSDVYVVIEEEKFEGAFGVDNFGSRFLGSYKLDGQAVVNSPFGKFGRTALRVIGTGELEEMKYVSLAHEVQLGSEGTKAIFSSSYTDTEPGHTLEAFNLEGESFNASAKVQHPLIRSRRENLFWQFGFSYKVSESSSFGTRQFRDDIRTIYSGVSYDVFDALYGTNKSDVIFTKGLDIMGASDSNDTLSRGNGQANFEKLNFSYTRIQSIPDLPISLFLASEVQLAWVPLLSAEEFGIGGQNIGRAYDPSEISGDKGVAATFEVRYATQTTESFIESFQPFVFYDVGKVWNERAFAGEANSASLASAGIGSRFNFEEDVSGELVLALPLTREIQSYGTNGDDLRILFNLTKRF